MRCLELFAGAGGLSLSLRQSGFQHCLLVDTDDRAIRTLQRNGFKKTLKANVKDVNFKHYRGVDLVAAGVPCQPWSIGGVDCGQADERNGWEPTLRAIRECMPRAIMLECVSGILRPKFSAYLDSVLSRLEEMGHSVTVHNVNAADFSCPQHRKRAFFVGFCEKGILYTPPTPSGRRINVAEALAPLGKPDGRINRHVAHGHAKTYTNHNGSDPSHPPVAQKS